MKAVSARSKNPAKPSPADVRRKLLASLEGTIEPASCGLSYRAGLLLVAVTMLVLPLIYLALIGLVGYGLCWHVVHDVDVLTSGGAHAARGAFVAYFGPIFAGAILMAFMLRPLLVRDRDDSVPLTLRQVDEPLLFEFVYRLCRVLGARAPVRIDVDLNVNASASFRGRWRGLLRRELVLTIGLPLAGCLDARQFAGVLAHELGHFSQGSAMRLTYIVRTVNAWFFRIVYYRDHWDRELARASRNGSHWIIALVALVTRGMIWVVRRVLWCIMMVGHAISAMMLRQMEYDADRYECRVAGATAFAQTFERLRCMSVAQMAAFSDLSDAWRERRLADDLPAFIRARETDLPADLRATLFQQDEPQKTGWFDSHPCEADRLAAARRQNAQGIFTADMPATELFTDFAGLSRVATMLYYRRRIGKAFQPHQLVQTGNLVAARVEQEQTHDALARYLRGLVDAVRPVFPAPVPPAPKNRDAAAESLLTLRGRLREIESAAREAAAQFDAADERAMSLAAARELRTAGFRKSGAKDPAIDAMSDDALKAAERQVHASRHRAIAAIEPALRLGLERLALALSLEQPAEAPKPADVAAATAEESGAYELAEEQPAGAADRVTAALNALRTVAPDLEAIRWHLMALRVLVPRLRPADNGRPLIDALLWHSRKAAGLLREVYQRLTHVTYPYADPGKRLTLSGYIVPSMPPPEEVGRVGAAAASATEAYRSIYRRLMADLASRAEQVERSLGLPPLEDPDPAGDRLDQPAM